MLILQSASLIDTAHLRHHMYKYVNLVNHEYCIVTWSIASLPGIGITSEICLLTATLADKDNPSSDALLSDNSSNSQETFVEGRRVRSQMSRRDIYSAHACSVSKSPLISSVMHMM